MTTKVKVKVPNRSGFDKSHQNILTTKVGTLTPILCDELIPNSHVNLETAISASLPPLASDTFMRCDLKVEAFFVPSRILYGGYEDWLTNNLIYDAEQDQDLPVKLPRIAVDDNYEEDLALTAPGTLFDYLGGKTMSGVPSGETPHISFINALPFLAYHKIYDDWYRNTQVKQPLFMRDTIIGTNGKSIMTLPYAWISDFNYNDGQGIYSLTEDFRDGVKLGDLRQRNFGLDYFTVASPTAQMGTEKKVSFLLLRLVVHLPLVLFVLPTPYRFLPSVTTLQESVCRTMYVTNLVLT